MEKSDPMKQFEFNLNLNAQECERYYRGQANQVVAKCIDGTNIQFPATLIRPFLTGTGVRGQFVLTCDDDGKNSRLGRR